MTYNTLRIRRFLLHEGPVTQSAGRFLVEAREKKKKKKKKKKASPKVCDHAPPLRANRP